MLNIVFTLLPIFLLISLGYYFHKQKTFSEGFWSGIEHLCYYILFPSLIINTLSKTNFNDFPAINIAYTMGGSVVIMVIIVGILYFPARALGVSGASYSSIFQGATRWNTFAMIAIIDGFYGHVGVSIAAIAVAVMIPILNIANVIALAIMAGKNKPSIKSITNLLVKNPLIVACFIGLLINFTGISLWKPLSSMMELLGRSALALSLMAVGVGVSFVSLKKAGLSVIFTSTLKLALMPAIMFVLCDFFGVEGIPRTIAILCGASPTAAASFILSRKMGGDSTLMANIISLETLLSVITIPIILYYIGV
ncbi:MAG: AEC family transporter [Rhizobiales bacterium]|nr:AEC family transporter [Hyphomicrobiales bacterium]